MGYLNGFFFERNVTSFVEALKRLKEADLQAMSFAARSSVDPEWAWKNKAQNYGTAIKAVHAKGGIR